MVYWTVWPAPFGMLNWVMAVAKPSEFDFIAKYLKPLALKEPGALGLTDDAAVLTLPKATAVVATSDMLVEGVHFFKDDPAFSIARKVLGVNLSDLAGMGAEPHAYLLSIAVPSWVDDNWLEQFCRGLSEMQERYEIALVGGDTVSTPGPLTLSVTALGKARDGRFLSRSRAKPGDLICVSGTIGDGALGLLVRQGKLVDDTGMLVESYLHPVPQLELGSALIGVEATAMDISDGLMQDLGHLCDESGCGAQVYRDKIPLSTAAQKALCQNETLWDAVLGGGDDYQLLFGIFPKAKEMLDVLLAGSSVRVSEIGSFRKKRGIELLDGKGRTLHFSKGGFKHF